MLNKSLQKKKSKVRNEALDVSYELGYEIIYFLAGCSVNSHLVKCKLPSLKGAVQEAISRKNSLRKGNDEKHLNIEWFYCDKL